LLKKNISNSLFLLLLPDSRFFLFSADIPYQFQTDSPRNDSEELPNVPAGTLPKVPEQDAEKIQGIAGSITPETPKAPKVVTEPVKISAEDPPKESARGTVAPEESKQ
jgi:hypothetical protein